MAHIITFVDAGARTRYISCVSLAPPAKISYSSSERAVDAVKLPYPVANHVCDMLNTRWSLGASVGAVKVRNG